MAPGEEQRGGPQKFMGRTAKIVGGFRPPIPGPTSTGPDCSSGTSNFAGSTSSSGPTDPSIDNYACDFPSGRTGAHPNLTSAIHQSFPDCETDACDFPSGSHPCLTWCGGHPLNQPNTNTHNCNPAPAPNHVSLHLLPGLPHRDT